MTISGFPEHNIVSTPPTPIQLDHTRISSIHQELGGSKCSQCLEIEKGKKYSPPVQGHIFHVKSIYMRTSFVSVYTDSPHFAAFLVFSKSRSKEKIASIYRHKPSLLSKISLLAYTDGEGPDVPIATGFKKKKKSRPALPFHRYLSYNMGPQNEWDPFGCRLAS